MTPQVSVIIPTHADAGPLARTLSSLRGQTLDHDRFEVIVVADGLNSGAQAVLSSVDRSYRLRFLAQPRRGAASARNLGAEAAKASLLLFLDDDMEAAPRLIAEHSAAHADRSGSVVLGHFGASGAKLSDPFFAAYVRAWWSDHLSEMARPDHRFTFKDLHSGNFSIPASSFAAAVGFDSTFGPHAGEDWELGIRLLASGLRLRYAPNATAIHHENPTVPQSLRRAFAEGRGHVLIARRHPEVLGALPLAKFVDLMADPSRWERRHGRNLPASSRWRLGLRLARRLRLRRLFRHRFGALRGRAYWSGALAELGSLSSLRRLIQEAPRLDAADRGVSLDLSWEAERLRAKLESEGADSAMLWIGRYPIGRVAGAIGSEPLRLPHIRRALRTELPRAAIRALRAQRAGAASDAGGSGAVNGLMDDFDFGPFLASDFEARARMRT